MKHLQEYYTIVSYNFQPYYAMASYNIGQNYTIVSYKCVWRLSPISFSFTSSGHNVGTRLIASEPLTMPPISFFLTNFISDMVLSLPFYTNKADAGGIEPDAINRAIMSLQELSSNFKCFPSFKEKEIFFLSISIIKRILRIRLFFNPDSQLSQLVLRHMRR